MKVLDIGNLNFNNIFLSDINDIILPLKNDSISNESQSDSKEDVPIKQQIKFISTKQEYHNVNLLQKKTNPKKNRRMQSFNESTCFLKKI